MLFLSISCQENDSLSGSNVGYLRLQLGVNESTLTKADIPYNPEQMAVQIVNAEGTVVAETTNWATEWKDTQIALPVGTYTLNASSAGFDGQSSGFNKPYYAGSTQFVIEKGKEINATVTCTLANVKVTVNFDESFQKYFKAASVEVGQNQTNTEVQDGSNTIAALLFEMGQDKGSGYFPAVDLQAKVNITNHNDEIFSQTDAIRGVKPRDHYILNYSVGAGEGGIDIDVDETTYVYTFHIDISTIPKTALGAPRANAWAKLAYLEGEVISSSETLNPDLMKLQYRKNGDSEWTDATTTVDGETYKATVTELQPATEYESRMVYGNNEYSSETTKFTTEETVALYNADFENWYTYNGIQYATASDDATSTDSENFLNAYWDSGNPGAATMNKNPTQASNDTRDGRGQSAMLSSQFVGMLGIGKFAAGNIYTGHYCNTFMSPMGARIRFGQEFNARPTQLKGWYKYTRGTDINYSQNETYKSELENSGGDKCAIYIALTDNIGLTEDSSMKATAFEINNNLTEDDPENFKYKYTIDFSENNPHIVAYGSITDEEAQGTGGIWKEFTIDLKYRSLDRKPKYIIVVASASKYGDYFTGSTGSVMYIDDFELTYEPLLEN